MFCIHCGSENLEEARFCAGCGRNVQATTPGNRGAGPPLSSETEMGLVAGQVLSDRFEIQKVIGIGGMGRVYLAQDLVLERPVAVKVLREVLSRDTGSVRRLVEEAKASIRLAHPNIVRVDDYHDAGTVKFLAMEYIEGETLADRLARERKLAEEESRRIAIEVCRGLEHAHTNKVIHRDLKPGNIMLVKDGAVKIADFGIARIARDSVSRLTSQQDSGTLLYMSPEQLLGRTSAASDMYSLGIVLYEMLSGEPPFQSGDVPYQIREAAPVSLEGVSPQLNEIVMRCLEKKPERRFASMRELRKVLERFRDRRPAAAEPQKHDDYLDEGEKPESCQPEGVGDLEELIERAERGDVHAQVDLGVRFRDGRGEVKDGVAVKWFQAVKWFRKAAEQGFARGQTGLGRMYQHGRGVPEDLAQAIQWFRKAAEQGAGGRRGTSPSETSAGYANMEPPIVVL